MTLFENHSRKACVYFMKYKYEVFEVQDVESHGKK